MTSNGSSRVDIAHDDLTPLQGGGPAFVTFGETMLRDTPADKQRPQATRLVDVSLAGSEYSIAVLLARMGVPSGYVTRLPDNPYGWMLHDDARSHGIDADGFVWAHAAESFGRYIYEPGRSPRAGRVWYQRMHSAASRLDAGMVDWAHLLRDCRLLHGSGISFGLAVHSAYERNYLLHAFGEAMANKPASCLVGMDFNFRSTLWTKQQCTDVMGPLLEAHTDVLITSVYDMAGHFGVGAGRYSAADINNGQMGDLHDDDLRAFGKAVTSRFGLKVVAMTMRRSITSEEHEWEAAAVNADGDLYRTQVPRRILLQDRLGGGDAWNGGFYYGLLTSGHGVDGLAKGVCVGDAATALKQTLMFDLPLLRRDEIGEMLRAGASATARTVR